MTERRILVIGSQCQALQELPFLPRVAHELYAVMTDPERGACVSAIEGGGLLLNPSVNDAKRAIRSAYRRAAIDEAALFVAYIGHGERAYDDYYLLPLDAQYPPDSSDTALHLTNLIKETHRGAAGRVDGLAVLIDACYAGVAGFGAANAWVSGLQGTLRFEVLTAAADRPAADGCFSLTLTRLLRDGISTVPAEHLRCADLRTRIEQSCPNQVPQNPAYNPDETLWLARNGGHVRHPWAQTALADQIERLTRAYQVTPALENVVTLSGSLRCVAVVGAAGAGKSALSAALAWPEVAKGVVPVNFVQAAAFLTEATTPQELARTIAEQLTRSVPLFHEAQRLFAQQTPHAEQQRLGILERQVIGPLGRLSPESDVRFVIDALDRLATGARGPVMDALNELARLPFSRLIVTARPDTPLPNDYAAAGLSPASPEAVARYLEERAIVQTRRREIVTIASGNWLVARVLADLLGEDPSAEIRAGQPALRDCYEELLTRCGADDNNDTQVVLSVLAAAGAGPLLPLKLLCAASEKLGGPATQAGIHDELFRLRGLVVRDSAGTEREHAGVFHDTLAAHIVDHAPQTVLAGHRALADCIRSLAPPDTLSADMTDPIQRYAFEREAEHLWALGDTDAALRCLRETEATVPRDNLRRWRLWWPRLENYLGVDHPNMLGIRGHIASWTGECGETREALRLFAALLSDQERVLGSDDPNTLTIRGNIARWRGASGDAREALRLCKALLPDLARVLGADHPSTLSTRGNIASWTGQCGDAEGALRLYAALLPDEQRVLGPDDPSTLTTRANIAGWTGECGQAHEARRLFEMLLPDLARVLGADHPSTLATRHNIAGFTGQCGEAHEALRLFAALLSDHKRVLGADHPNTLATQVNIAQLTGQCGEMREALRLYAALLLDQERVLGTDHPDTLRTCGSIAGWTGKCGEAREALRLYAALLPDQERVLGPDHPDTLSIRDNIASLTEQCGEGHEALRLYAALLPDQQRVLGADHPRTLRTRNNVAVLTEQCGEAREALRLFETLLPDQKRVLGADHSDTLTTRNNIASLTGQCGETHEALRLFAALLPDHERVLGPEHPDTLRTRNDIAGLTAQSGEAREALRLFEPLLPDLSRVLGADHPDTLTTRNNIAQLTRQCGEAREALRLYAALLPDQERVLGPDHPSTLTTRDSIAGLTAQCGEAHAALRLYAALLPDQERVLGPDHPSTLTTRNSIASLTAQCGEAREALWLYAALLPDEQRVLGADHPDTLRTRNNIAGLTVQCGEAREALRLFEMLLHDLARVLGADHPYTLATRNSIAILTAQCGETHEALRLFATLLPDQERVLGGDHPDTLTTRELIRDMSRERKRCC
jgi:hypothetical protein